MKPAHFVAVETVDEALAALAKQGDEAAVLAAGQTATTADTRRSPVLRKRVALRAAPGRWGS